MTPLATELRELAIRVSAPDMKPGHRLGDVEVGFHLLDLAHRVEAVEEASRRRSDRELRQRVRRLFGFELRRAA